MPLPTIAFGILLSTCCGAFYHFIRGGSSKKLALYLILAWAGFWAGDSLGWYLGWSVVPVGVLNAGTGAIFSFIFLGIGDLVSRSLSVQKD
ncbi:MAG TPA: hypothetical protein VGK00_07360 [Anaerolineales bacterium]|jgi:hypothetical protein